MILSRVSFPDRSPSAIIRAAGRSFTEPPGFFHSALAYSSTFRRSASKLVRRINGVFPIKSTIEAVGRDGPGVTTDISDCNSRKLYTQLPDQLPIPNFQLPTAAGPETGSWELGGDRTSGSPALPHRGLQWRQYSASEARAR